MDDYLQRLERLAGLFERGALTKEEFEAEKARLLHYGAHTLEVEAEAPAGPAKLSRRDTRLLAAVLIVATGAILGLGVWRDLAEATRMQDAPDKVADQNASATKLDDVIRFSDAKSCTPADSFSELLQRMEEATASDPGSTDRRIQLPGFKEPFEVDAAIHGSGDNEARIARVIVGKPWHGLRVTEIRSTRWPDATGVQIRFQQSLSETAKTLRRLGFHIPAVGKLAAIDGGHVGLEWVGQESAVTCVRAANAETEDSGNDSDT